MHGKNSLKKAGGKEKIFLLLSVIAVVAVSGCISLGNLFGSSTTTVEASNDVMAVSDSTVIPNPPILTGDTFTTAFTIKNLDEFEDAKNVKVQLYDWGACVPSTCLEKSKDGYSYSKDYGDISPNDVQQVECQFKSPPSEKIGGISASCPIRYKLTYDFSGITTTDLNVISNKKFQDMQRAGQTPTVTSVQSKSRGPIKVDFSFGVNQPVRTSTTSNSVKIPMYIRVENKGSGKAKLGSATFISNSVKCTDANGAVFNSGDCFGNGVNTFFCNNGNIESCGKNGPEYGENNKVDTTICAKNNGCIKSNADLNIKIPAAFTSSGDTTKCTEINCDGFFTGSADGTDSCKLRLNKNIEFVKDKSQVFRCELTSPDENAYLQQIGKDFEQKTYSIQSEVKYTYQIDNDFSVAIKPMTTG